MIKTSLKSLKVVYAAFLVVSLFMIGGTGMRASDNSTYVNPILGGDYPDPTIIRDGNDYYMTHSAFEYLPGLIVFHSTDLVNWEPISYALDKNLGSVWAPDICKFNGKYYIYFTVSKGNDDFYNYVVTADTPYGPWSVPVDLKVTGYIDPCHVYDEKKNIRWMFLSGGHRIRLAEDGLSTTGNLEKVYNGWKIPSDWIVEGFALEGPKIRKIRDYYYLLNAEGGTAGPATTHMVVVARSKSIDGPWENDPNNPLVHTYSASEQWWSKGHGSLIDTPDGEWWIVYHAYRKDRINQGRQTLMEPIEITANGWLKATMGKDVDLPIRKPIQVKAVDYSFTRMLPLFRIGKEWKGLLDYVPNRYTIKDGTMVVQAQGNNPASSSPLLFVAPDRDFEISARFENKGDIESGLLFYYNSKFFAGMGCNQQRSVCWRRGEKRLKGTHHLGSTVWMKLRYKDNVITGYLSSDGKTWALQQWGVEVSGYNHNTLSGFLSLLPGVFCYGEGNVTILNFTYNPI